MTLVKSPQTSQSDFGHRPILFGAVPGFQHIGVIATAGVCGGIATVAFCGGILPALPVLGAIAIGTANDLAWKCKQELESDYDNEVEVESEKVADETPIAERVDYASQPEYTEPNPWGQLTEVKSNATQLQSKATQLQPACPSVYGFGAWEENECMVAGITIDEYRRICEQVPDDAPRPSATHVGLLLGRTPLHATAQPPSPPAVEAVEQPVEQPVEGRWDEAVESVVEASVERIEQTKTDLKNAYKRGVELDDTSHMRKGNAYWLLRSCYELDPAEQHFSQNWLISNVFRISKGTKAHDYFRNVRSIVRQDMGLL